jgi:hypothetical protein
MSEEMMFRKALLKQLTRIADALEAANQADPLVAIEQALGIEHTNHMDAFDANHDMPPAQRRAIEAMEAG